MEPLRALDPKAWVHFPGCHYFRCLVTLGWRRSNAIYKFTGGRQRELHVWSLPWIRVLCPLTGLNLYPFPLIITVSTIAVSSLTSPSKSSKKCVVWGPPPQLEIDAKSGVVLCVWSLPFTFAIGGALRSWKGQAAGRAPIWDAQER